MALPHIEETIPGWFNFHDIYREQVERARDGAVFVEVGSWLGKSTSFLAVEIANARKDIALYAVDTWKGSPAAQYQDVVREHGGSVLSVFQSNMRRAGVEDSVCPLVGHSVEMAHAFRDRSIDFVFLDAAHDFHSVRADVAAWLPKIRSGGVLAGHDANCPGLLNAVYEHIARRDVALVGTSWIVRELGYYEPEPEGETWETRSIIRKRLVGIWDVGLGALARTDYARRLRLAGLRESDPGEVTAGIAGSDLKRYAAKWGGPPGDEKFEFAYGVTTLDW